MSDVLSATERAAAASNLLMAIFPGRVITPQVATEFDAERMKPWSQTCWIPSTAHISLATAQEVADVLAIIRRTGSKFAIRGAGHNPNAGFSSVGDGIVLDLGQLKSKTLGEDGVAQIEAGNTWGEVFAWLEAEGRSAVGARQEEVGVGGFLLGGGLGPFPNKHGLGVDNVRNFEVVLADGSQVSANIVTNPDLFWALKGGGTNFGVVTRFDIATYPLVKTQYTISLYDDSDVGTIISASTEVQKAMETDSKIGFFVNFRSGIVVVGMLYADIPTEPLKVFDTFSKLPNLRTNIVPTTNGTILSLAKAMAHPDDSLRRAISSVTTKPLRELYEGVNKIFKEVKSSLPDAVQIHYTAQPVGPSCVEAGIAQGGNSLGLKRIMQDWWVFTVEWAEEGHDAVAYNALAELAERTRQLAREMGLLLDYVSSSFAGASDDVLGSYGTENVERLQATAAKYDPDGVFQSLQNDGFLLRNLSE